MSRQVYLNGAYCNESDAKVSIFDRGFLFADGVYEVTTVLDSKLLDFDGHYARLQLSLDKLQLSSFKLSRDELLEVHRQLVTRNSIVEGMIYLQVTRGNPGDRDFAYPSDSSNTPATVVLFTQDQGVGGLTDAAAAEEGMRVMTLKDLRWGRVDIKTVQLLYPSMVKMAAKGNGMDDGWMFEGEEGDSKEHKKKQIVTEGSSNNAYIVKDGTIITRQLGNHILAGITRAAVLRFANENAYKVEERGFSVQEAYEADEAFITSATTFLIAVVSIDKMPIGDGSVGPVSTALRAVYIQEMRKTAI